MVGKPDKSNKFALILFSKRYCLIYVALISLPTKPNRVVLTPNLARFNAVFAAPPKRYSGSELFDLKIGTGASGEILSTIP